MSQLTGSPSIPGNAFLLQRTSSINGGICSSSQTLNNPVPIGPALPPLQQQPNFDSSFIMNGGQLPVNVPSASSQFVQATMVEMQRLREENQMQKDLISKYEDNLQVLCKVCC